MNSQSISKDVEEELFKKLRIFLMISIGIFELIEDTV